METICEICGTKRITEDKVRRIENEENEPCINCFEWIDNEYTK